MVYHLKLWEHLETDAIAREALIIVCAVYIELQGKGGRQQIAGYLSAHEDLTHCMSLYSKGGIARGRQLGKTEGLQLTA